MNKEKKLAARMVQRRQAKLKGDKEVVRIECTVKNGKYFLIVYRVVESDRKWGIRMDMETTVGNTTVNEKVNTGFRFSTKEEAEAVVFAANEGEGYELEIS